MAHQHVCPWWLSFTLVGPLRQIIQNPKNILAGIINAGDHVLDFGCGPGFFTTTAAEMVGKSGAVVAADLQERMLKMARKRIRRKGFEDIVQFHQSPGEGIGLEGAFNVILAFNVIHELPDSVKFINEAAALLKPEGRLYILEPRGHVTEEAFSVTLSDAEASGLKVKSRPSVRSSRSAVLVK